MNNLQTLNRGSIGVLSTEFKVTSGGLIRFVKINGVAPTHPNVASGKYTAYADASFNTRLIAPTTAAARGYANFVSGLKTAFASSTTIDVINGLDQPFGPSGLMALDQLATPIPASDFTGATPRNPWSRAVGGTDLNNCAPGIQASF